MKRIMFVALVFAAVVLLSACGQAAVTPELTAILKYIWVPQDFHKSYAMSTVNYDEEAVIYSRNEPLKRLLTYTSLEDGSDIKTIEIPAGEGPGEMRGSQAIDVADGIITIFDNNLAKIIVYSSTGEHIDDYALNSDIGLPMTSTVVGDHLYINGKIRHKLLKYSLTGNNVVKKIEYENVNETPESGEPFPGGLIRHDSYTGSLFLGYYRKPFRLEQYDSDLNLIKTYTAEGFDNCSACEWCITRNNIFTQQGDRIIGGIAFDEKYIYASYGGGYDYTGDESAIGRFFEYREAPLKVIVFDRQTGKHTASVTVDKIPSINGFIRLLHADKKNMIFQLCDKSDVLNEVIGRERGEGEFSTFAIATVDNPVYKQN